MKTNLILHFFVLLVYGCSSELEDTDKINSTFCELCPTYRHNQDTISFVREVQQFISSHSKGGMLPNQEFDTIFNLAIEDIDVDVYLQIFDNNQGTMKCGGTALLMVKTLIDNGIRAYTYNFGFSDTEYTHVVVLVYLGGEYLIFDPFLGYEMLYNEKNLSLDRLIGLVGNDQHIGIRYSNDSVLYQELYETSFIDTVKIPEGPCKEHLEEDIYQLNDSVYVVNKWRCFACDTLEPCSSFILGFQEELRLKTNYEYFYEGMIFKINEITGFEDAQYINNRIDRLLRIKE